MEEKIFSKNLKIFLQKQKITQKTLAEKLGVAQPTISNIINGRDRLGRQTAFKWAEVLDIDPLWLMTQGEQGWVYDRNCAWLASDWDYLSGDVESPTALCYTLDM